MKQPGGEPKPTVSADYIRHSKAAYKTYGAIVGSEEPTKPFDPEAQVTPDLTAEGKALAEQEARKYYERLDPQQDQLFFVSSNEARALETADIYRRIAHEKGFEVVKPTQTRSEYATNLTEGEVRVLNTLSLNSKNMVLDFMFNPRVGRKAINWEAVDPAMKEKFERGAALVESSDQGTFGANFLKHSAEVKRLVPEISSAVDLYETRFKGMLRLALWAEKRASTEELKGKHLKIMAFGHENALVHPLKEFFEEEGLNNCEVVEFSLADGKIEATYRGKEKEIV